MIKRLHSTISYYDNNGDLITTINLKYNPSEQYEEPFGFGCKNFTIGQLFKKTKQYQEKIENQAAELKKANIRNNHQRIELKRLNAYRVDNQQQIQDQAKEIEGKSIYIKNLKAACKEKHFKVMRERDELREENKELKQNIPESIGVDLTKKESWTGFFTTPSWTGDDFRREFYHTFSKPSIIHQSRKNGKSFFKDAWSQFNNEQLNSCNKKIENQRKELRRLNEINARATQRIKELKKTIEHISIESLSKSGVINHHVRETKQQAKKIEELKLWIDDKEQELSDIRKTVAPLKNEIKELKSTNKDLLEWNELNHQLWANLGLEEEVELFKEINAQKETIQALTRENTRLEQLVSVGTSPSYDEIVKLQHDIEINQYQSRIGQLEKDRKELTEEKNQLQENYECLLKVVNRSGTMDQWQDLKELKQEKETAKKIISELTEANVKLKEKLTRAVDMLKKFDLSFLFKDGL